MIVMKFHGIVQRGDDSRTGSCSDDGSLDGAIHIGGVDVVGRIADKWPTATKTIAAIGDESFSGELFVETGWGYTEWTPMESDTLRIGDHDLIEDLGRHDGKTITLWVSDEPINVLEEYEVEK